jgi:uncharacterized membrane protein YdbT with pleckstrin-like domain
LSQLFSFVIASCEAQNPTRKVEIMNNEVREKRGKRRFFPSWGGVFAGLIPGVFSLFHNFSTPFWVTYNLILIVVAFGFAAANLIGLAVVRSRRSSPPGNGL